MACYKEYFEAMKSDGKGEIWEGRSIFDNPDIPKPSVEELFFSGDPESLEDNKES